MQQYFSKKRKDNILYLNEVDLHHIKNVMRFKPGTKLIVNYDNISYNCCLNEDYLTVNIEDIYKSGDGIYIHAYIPVLTEEKMSFVFEKGTEMGVSEFTPVNFERCKFVLNKEKELKKKVRWEKIVKEASEQSRRVIIPKVNNIINVKNIDICDGVNILCSLDKENVKSIKKVLNEESICDKINLVFGPEGGISKTEENYLENIGFVKTSLGPNVLRTETVIINVCSVINYVKGE